MRTRTKRGRSVSDDQLKKAFSQAVRSATPAARKAKSMLKKGLQTYINATQSLANKIPGGSVRSSRGGRSRRSQ